MKSDPMPQFAWVSSTHFSDPIVNNVPFHAQDISGIDNKLYVVIAIDLVDNKFDD